MVGIIVVKDLEAVSNPGKLAATSRTASRQHLAQLFDTEFDAIYRFCLARTGDCAAADDAASETFMAAARCSLPAGATRSTDPGCS